VRFLRGFARLRLCFSICSSGVLEKPMKPRPSHMRCPLFAMILAWAVFSLGQNQTHFVTIGQTVQSKRTSEAALTTHLSSEVST